MYVTALTEYYWLKKSLKSVKLCLQFEEWEEKIRAVQAKAAIAAEEESIASSEAASEQRPVKRGRPKKRSESSGKKVSSLEFETLIYRRFQRSPQKKYCVLPRVFNLYCDSPLMLKGSGGRPRHHGL